MMNSSWKTVFQITAPVGMGYLPTGFAFGVLATQTGLPALFVVAMSVFLFAGALQFAALPLLSGAAGWATIAMTSLLVNLRHVLYAIPLIDHLPQGRWGKAYVIAALTDENYSVLTTLPTGQRQAMAIKISLLNHGYWIAGTALGAVLGVQAAGWIPDLSFALPALFTILAIEQYLARHNGLPIAVGLGAYLLARALLPAYALITALALGLVCLSALASRRQAPAHAHRADAD